MKSPKITVSINPSDLEVMQILCHKYDFSMSALAKKMISEWLEDYEDMLLAKRAEESEKRWIKAGCKTISHEKLCKELGIKSNISKTQ